MTERLTPEQWADVLDDTLSGYGIHLKPFAVETLASTLAKAMEQARAPREQPSRRHDHGAGGCGDALPARTPVQRRKHLPPPWLEGVPDVQGSLQAAELPPEEDAMSNPTPETPGAAPLTDAELDLGRRCVAQQQDKDGWDDQLEVDITAYLLGTRQPARIADVQHFIDMHSPRMWATIDALRSRLDHLEDCKAELDAVVEVMGGSSGFDPEKPSLADDVRTLRARLAEVEGERDEYRDAEVSRSEELDFALRSAANEDEALRGELDAATTRATQAEADRDELRALYDEALAQVEAARREAAALQASLDAFSDAAEFEDGLPVAFDEQAVFRALRDAEDPHPALDTLITEAVEAERKRIEGIVATMVGERNAAAADCIDERDANAYTEQAVAISDVVDRIRDKRGGG